MPDDWKEKAQKELDKAFNKGEIDKKTYKKLKKALKDAKTITGFVKDYLSGNGGILRTLGKKKGLKWKAAGCLINILIMLVEAGPCPWTGIIVARINKLIADAMAESVPPKRIIRRLHILKRKYTTAHSICTRQANGMYSPQDINKAYAMEIQKVPGVSTKIAQAIVDGAAKESFHTPWEAMRIRGVTQEIIDNLLEGGFYFGISGAAMLGPLEIAPDMSREAKIHVEFGFTGGPLVEQTCSIGRNVEPIEEEREFDGPKLSAGHKLAVRLIDSSGRTVGYRTAAGTALTIEDLEVDIRSGRRNLELVKIHGRSYLRRPANDTEADNLSKLQVERIDRL